MHTGCNEVESLELHNRSIKNGNVCLTHYLMTNNMLSIILKEL